LSKPPPSVIDASFVIVGGGLPSLVLAHLLQLGKSDPRPVVVVEKSAQLGGQFRSETNSSGKTFDLGMHIYYETGLSDIDSVIRDLLPDEEWNFLEGNLRDLAGIFFNGSLQINSPYPDLRNFAGGSGRTAEYFLDLCSTLEARGELGEGGDTAIEVLTSRFGPLIAQEIHAPILEKLYCTLPSKLHPLAAHLTKMDRVVLFDERSSAELMKSDKFRKRIAYPSQLNLPNVRTSSYRGIYPKTFGFGAVVDLLSSRLNDIGVKFLTDATVTGIHLEGGSRVTGLQVSIGEKVNFTTRVREGVVWSTDPYSLSFLLGNETPKDIRKPRKKYYVHVALHTRPNLGGLYYAYVFDNISDIFRITDYTSYCADASSDGLYPISVEYWPKVGAQMQSLEEEVLQDLQALGVISARSDVQSVTISSVPAAFPDPTLESVHSLERIFEFISDAGLANLSVTGPLSRQGVFFLHEVLRSGYQEIKQRDWV
jgi:phytoene dehydrogenase-like protein